MDLVKYLGACVNMYFGQKNLNLSYTYIKNEVKLWHAIVLVLILSLGFSFLAANLNPLNPPLQLIQILFYSTVGFGLFVFITLGIIQMFINIFDGKELFADTLKFGISAMVFFVILTMVVEIIDFLAKAVPLYEILFDFITGLIALGIFLWMVIVLVQLYAKVHGVSVGKSIIAVIIAIIISILILLVLISIFFTTVVISEILVAGVPN